MGKGRMLLFSTYFLPEGQMIESFLFCLEAMAEQKKTTERSRRYKYILLASNTAPVYIM